MRLGSLFSGYLGLDLAVQSVLGGHTAWVCDNDPGASLILQHRAPNAPNLGDITRVDWANVPAVDILTGGFPCTDLSQAGLRLGLRPDTRSGLWTHFAYAISVLRPRLVVIENVRGLLSADAHRDVEPGTGPVGDGADRPVHRAAGAVLGDLADIGFDAEWVGLPASAVGACHRRFREFILAWPQSGYPDSSSDRYRWGSAGFEGQAGSSPRRVDVQDTDGPTGRERWLAAPGQASGRGPRPDACGRGGTSAAVTDGGGHGTEEDRRGMGCVDGGHAGQARQRERARPEPQRRGSTACPTCGCDTIHHDADGFCAGPCGGTCTDPEWGRPAPTHTDRAGLEGRAPAAEHAHEWAPRPGSVEPAPHPDSGGLESVGWVDTLRCDPHGRGSEDIAWGDYEPAVRRWESVTGRSAPSPVEPGRTGPRLSPRFVEWMMGLPDGWVTGVPGLTRNAQLKALGNGVVPQQAAAALRLLLPAALERAA